MSHEAGRQVKPTIPLVSVIVPLYNKAKCLPTMMDSVLSQDIGSLELICVDDCSTDESIELVQRYAKSDSRVKLVCHEANKGPGAARNTGIEHALGDFLAFLDADDWYNDSAYLSRLCNGARENGVLAAGASLCNVWSGGFEEREFGDDPAWSGYTFAQSGVMNYADYQFDYGSPRFIYARELFEDGTLRFDGRRFFEDPPIMVRALSAAGSFYADAHAEYMYLQEYRPDSWNTRKVLDLLEGVRLNLDFSREHDLAKLHWITLHHLEWESSDVSLGIRGDIDIEAVDEALTAVERAIDSVLLNRFDSGSGNHVPLLRERIDMVKERGSRGLAASMEYRLLHTRLWYSVRTARDKRRYNHRYGR